jgi:hypothetical protein
MPARRTVGTSATSPNAIRAVPSTDEASHRLEIYKLLVEMADRVSQRRQANNNFYLSVNTAIVGASAYLTASLGAHSPSALISAAGVIICIAWGWSIQSYKTLNSAKFAVIQDMEKLLPARPFTEEWHHLTGGSRSRHTPFHKVEVVVPWVFGVIHTAQLVAQFTWKPIFHWLCAVGR